MGMSKMPVQGGPGIVAAAPRRSKETCFSVLLRDGDASKVCAPSQNGSTKYYHKDYLTKLGARRLAQWRLIFGWWTNILFKTFLAGIFLGIVVCTMALHFVPVVDQYREVSMITVNPNGGNVETFHINIPMDRIMVGVPEHGASLPDGLEWPSDEKLSTLRAELFKIRNRKNAVIGVASRIAASDTEAGDVIEWVLHFPARGSVYVTMRPNPLEGGYRIGDMRRGTREFGTLRGQVFESWVRDTSGSEGAPAGRIELQTTLIAAQGEL